MSGQLSTSQIKEANVVLTDLMHLLRRAQPNNEHLVSLSVQLRIMISSNPEKLHVLVKNYLVEPHRDDIMKSDDGFIEKLHEEQGDMLGIGSCYKQLSLEDRAGVLYGLMRLVVILCD